MIPIRHLESCLNVRFDRIFILLSSFTKTGKSRVTKPVFGEDGKICSPQSSRLFVNEDPSFFETPPLVYNSWMRCLDVWTGESIHCLFQLCFLAELTVCICVTPNLAQKLLQLKTSSLQHIVLIESDKSTLKGLRDASTGGVEIHDFGDILVRPRPLQWHWRTPTVLFSQMSQSPLDITTIMTNSHPHCHFRSEERQTQKFLM